MANLFTPSILSFDSVSDSSLLLQLHILFIVSLCTSDFRLSLYLFNLKNLPIVFLTLARLDVGIISRSQGGESRKACWMAEGYSSGAGNS